MLRETAVAAEEVFDLKNSPETINQKIDATAIVGSGADAQALRAYLLGKGKISPSSHYKIVGEDLYFVRPSRTMKRGYKKDLLIKKINGMFFGNSSEVWARRNSRRPSDSHFAKPLVIQNKMERVIPMIPFILFKEAKLDVMKATVHEFGKPMIIDVGRKNQFNEPIMRHFAGGMVFSVEDQFFLFDVDHNEIKQKQFNAFMSKLPKPCYSFEEAYASLKPQEVYQAEKFLGHEVQRQGEWFFIPVKGNFRHDNKMTTHTRGWGANQKGCVKLQAKGNRAHCVDMICKEGYVKGLVTHEGYEHKPMMLDSWCKPVPNTAVQSFKISGAVD